MSLLLANAAVSKDIKSQQNFGDNHLHNMFRLFDVLSTFPFTRSEMMRE